MPRLKAALVPLFLATAFLPATTSAQTANGAVPGSLNFVQGQANIDGQPMDTSSDHKQPAVLKPGETLATANGTADLLLAPGALLRLGQNTTVQMVTGDAHRTEVRLEQGVANVSVNTVRHDDLLLVDTQNGQTQILSRGLYTVNAGTNTLRVFNGEALVFPGSDVSADVKPVKVKEGKEIILGGDRAKPASFDREMADNDLLPWTGPRESRAALTDNAVMYNGGYSAAGFAGDGYGFYGAPYAVGGPYGWGPYGFWGYPFFGIGFSSWGPGFWGYGPGFYGAGLYGGGFYRGGFYRGGYRPSVPHPTPGVPRSSFGGGGRVGGAGRGFSGGIPRNFGGASAGGGFHGGGGGFHGGGGGHR